MVAVIAMAVMAFSLNLPDYSGITGFFVKVGATSLTVMKEVMKTALTAFLKMLV
jgi:hypothetical protein